MLERPVSCLSTLSAVRGVGFLPVTVFPHSVNPVGFRPAVEVPPLPPPNGYVQGLFSAGARESHPRTSHRSTRLPSGFGLLFEDGVVLLAFLHEPPGSGIYEGSD